MPIQGAMRVTGGLFASLGAGGSLVAAGTCALLVVSAAIGLDGWPGLPGGDAAARKLVVGETVAPRAQRPGRPSSLAPARILLATEPGARAPRVPLAGGRVRAPAAAEAPAPTRTSAPARAVVRTAASAAADAVPVTSSPRPGEPVRRTAGGVSDAVTGAGAPLGAAVAPVSSAAGQTVGTTTETAGAAVQAAGQTAGDAVDHVLGP